MPARTDAGAVGQHAEADAPGGRELAASARSASRSSTTV
jgi:hypothetical protein